MFIVGGIWFMHFVHYLRILLLNPVESNSCFTSNERWWKVIFFIIKYNETQQLFHFHLIRVRRRRCEGQVWKAEIDWQEPESRKLLILAFNKKNFKKKFFNPFVL